MATQSHHAAQHPRLFKHNDTNNHNHIVTSISSPSTSTAVASPDIPIVPPTLLSNGPNTGDDVASSSSSLFSSDEAKFISDSFASAQSFDPFQHGAPGIKVPSLLPLGLIQSKADVETAKADPFTVAAGPSSQPWSQQTSNEWRSPSGQWNNQNILSAAPGNSGGQQYQQNQGATAHPRHTSWAPTSNAWPIPGQEGQHFSAHHQHPHAQSYPHTWIQESSSLPTSSRQSLVASSSPAAYWPPPQNSTPSRLFHNSQSFSAGTSSSSQWPPTVSGPADLSRSSSGGASVNSGPYGRNRAWQLQQLEALQAERKRYMEQVANGGGGGSSSDDGSSGLTPHSQHEGSSPQFSASVPGGEGSAPIPHSSASYWPIQLPNTADYLPGMAASHSNGTTIQSDQLEGAKDNLSTIALSFPSSHDFPDASPPARSHHGGSATAVEYPGSIGARLDQMSHSDIEMGGGNSGIKKIHLQQQQVHPTSTSVPKSKKNEAASSSLATGARHRSFRDDGDGTPWQKKASPSIPSEQYPPIQIRPQLVDRAFFTSRIKTTSSQEVDVEALSKAFYGRSPAEERRRLQPHLVDLKERRKEERQRKLAAQFEAQKSAKIKNRQSDAGLRDKMDSDAKTVADDLVADGSSEGKSIVKKAPHTLLTEAEKKANHIASEQKRRANIRKGYDLLSSGVPSLRDVLDDQGREGAADETGEGNETGDDKTDGRAGPRSEAVVLGHSVDHLRYLLEVHQDLRSRRDHARLRFARARLSKDILAGSDVSDNEGRARNSSSGGLESGGNKRGIGSAATAKKILLAEKKKKCVVIPSTETGHGSNGIAKLGDQRDGLAREADDQADEPRVAAPDPTSRVQAEGPSTLSAPDKQGQSTNHDQVQAQGTPIESAWNGGGEKECKGGIEHQSPCSGPAADRLKRNGKDHEDVGTGSDETMSGRRRSSRRTAATNKAMPNTSTVAKDKEVDDGQASLPFKREEAEDMELV